jgi:hypothetical protein
MPFSYIKLSNDTMPTFSKPKHQTSKLQWKLEVELGHKNASSLFCLTTGNVSKISTEKINFICYDMFANRENTKKHEMMEYYIRIGTQIFACGTILPNSSNKREKSSFPVSVE